MQSVATSVARRGGVATTAELLSDGHTEAGIRHAWIERDVLRPRKGWYLDTRTPTTLVAAVRVGGALTCVSALALGGFWTILDHDLHVEVAQTDSRLRSQADHRTRLTSIAERRVRTHWSPAHEARLMTDPLTSAVHAVQCLDLELAVATADSVLHRHPELQSRWRAFAEGAAHHQRPALLQADGVCESGIETLTSIRLGRLGLPIRRQVTLIGGRVDFVIGDRLVVEVDGAAYHTDLVRFEADRARDALLTRHDYRVLRFSYQQVMYRFDEVRAAVLAVVASGEHRR